MVEVGTKESEIYLLIIESREFPLQYTIPLGHYPSEEDIKILIMSSSEMFTDDLILDMEFSFQPTRSGILVLTYNSSPTLGELQNLYDFYLKKEVIRNSPSLEALLTHKQAFIREYAKKKCQKELNV